MAYFKIMPLHLITLLSTLLLTNQAIAHAEKDKARFVAVSGIDQGLCDNPLRPCKSLSFAISRAAKGDKVLVSAGTYQLESLDEVIAIKSRLVPVLGGYNRFDHFLNQSPSTNITQLIGLPSELTNYARQQGFTIMADGKSKFSRQKTSALTAQYAQAQQSHGAANCDDGLSAGFTCNNIELVSHVAIADFSSTPGEANDIWGHVDLNTHKEYALIGVSNGIAVFDISEPTQPKEVGTILGETTTWRDIKVYQYFDHTLNVWQAYAYATIDGKNDFVSIIDLNQLPASVSLVKKDQAVARAHNVYISNVDYTLNSPLNKATPTLQLIGSSGNNIASNSFISYSLAAPKSLSPLSFGNRLANDYTHDATSMRIDDERKNTDCNNDGKTCEVFIDFNEKEINIWNASIPGQEKKLSNITYNDVDLSFQYVHSGWWSEDKRYIFAHDEFDEFRANLNTTVRIFDLKSLTTPTLAGVWKGTTKAIDHNGFVRGNRYYMSNYKRGLTVLDITDASMPTEIGHFDTFTPSDSNGFDGAWGVYPYLPSGLLLVSDISGGLFILRDNTYVSEQGTVKFTQPSLDTQSNSSVIINVTRENSAKDAISVGWEILPGSALAQSDYTDASGVLNWGDNDTANKVISIEIADNTDINELEEKFFVRLFNPTSGATLSSPSYLTVNIEGKRLAGTIGFETDSLIVNESQKNITIDVFRSGGSDTPLSVNYALTSASAIISKDVSDISGTLSWADGDTTPKKIDLNIINDSTFENDETFNITLSPNGDTLLNSNPSLVITIKDDDKNTPPSITISESFEVNTNQTTSLTSSATDAEGDALSYLWTQISGTTVIIVNADVNEASFVSPNTAGILVFNVVATDSRGASSEKSVQVTVKEPKIAPPSTSSSGTWPISFTLLLIMTIGYRVTRST